MRGWAVLSAHVDAEVNKSRNLCAYQRLFRCLPAYGVEWAGDVKLVYSGYRLRPPGVGIMWMNDHEILSDMC